MRLTRGLMRLTSGEVPIRGLMEVLWRGLMVSVMACVMRGLMVSVMASVMRGLMTSGPISHPPQFIGSASWYAYLYFGALGWSQRGSYGKCYGKLYAP